jgi:DNA-3-methyladenine glycosylase I
VDGGLREGRCFGDARDPLLCAYHDREWGRPVTSERGLYERLCLEAFQAGLSWNLVLRRREALAAALAGFEPEAVAAFGPDDVAHALASPGVIRNRAKLEAAVANARAVLAMRAAGTSLVRVVWAFRPQPGSVPSPAAADWGAMPASTPASAALARELRRLGVRFIGPTAAYALMQAAGLVNDHFPGCPVRAEVQREQETAAAALAGGWPA